MKQLITGLILGIILSIGTAAVVPSLPIPPRWVISTISVTQIESGSVEQYFRLDVSEDNLNWKVVGCYAQLPALNAASPVLRIRDELPASPMRSFRRVPLTKAEFDAAPESGEFGTGIIIFKR